MSGSLSPGFFVGSTQNVCRIINSKQELEKYYDGERELPAIDFNAYTLVVGQQRMSHSSCYAEKFTIRKGISTASRPTMTAVVMPRMLLCTGV